MSRYRLNRKAARRKKSMKMGAGDLQEMIKDAVKAALAEEKDWFFSNSGLFIK